jgi:hypothetical protein
MYVRNIITEPSNTGLHFIVYGWDYSEQGKIVYLDFSTLHKRTCLPDEDFEIFALPHCVMGV